LRWGAGEDYVKVHTHWSILTKKNRGGHTKNLDRKAPSRGGEGEDSSSTRAFVFH